MINVFYIESKFKENISYYLREISETLIKTFLNLGSIVPNQTGGSVFEIFMHPDNLKQDFFFENQQVKYGNINTYKELVEFYQFCRSNHILCKISEISLITIAVTEEELEKVSNYYKNLF